jgi:flavin-dependent dehydrogenase
VCLVKPSAPGDEELRDPAAALVGGVARDVVLRERFERARLVGPPIVLGPLAVDAVDHTLVPDGLLLAGDASGFIDPMTGDGLRFAVRGGELAALAALRALEQGWAGVHAQLASTRGAEFAGKWRFNRMLRALIGSPAALRVASAVAPLVPAMIRAVIVRAGDCNLARHDLAEETEY